MDERFDVTVVIATYNRADMLPQALESVDRWAEETRLRGSDTKAPRAGKQAIATLLGITL